MNLFNFIGSRKLGISQPALGSFYRKSVAGIIMGIAAWITMAAPVTAEVHRLNDEEVKLFKRIAARPEQQRAELKLDPILCLVARQRAADMAKRNYFGHTNPNGKGPNYYVRREGYVLPAHYDPSRAANNIESIGQSIGTPQSMVLLWMNSSSHRSHLLGDAEFYREQTSIGVGVSRSSKAPYYIYYVFLSAPPNASLKPPVVILKNPKGETLATIRTLKVRADEDAF